MPITPSRFGTTIACFCIAAAAGAAPLDAAMEDDLAGLATQAPAPSETGSMHAPLFGSSPEPSATSITDRLLAPADDSALDVFDLLPASPTEGALHRN